MPTYKGIWCEGVCERFGINCQNEELYVDVATRYDAEPKRISGVMDIEGRKVEWAYYGLNVQDDKQKTVVNSLARIIKEEHPHMGLGDRRDLVRRYLLSEFPCHLECTLTHCAYSGTIHDQSMVRDNTCDVIIAQNNQGETVEEENDLETEYIDPLWPKKEEQNDNDETR